MHTISNLYRYPVKSMAGEAVQHSQLHERGMPGDRVWAVKDEERGGIRGGKRFPELLRCRASFSEEPDQQHPSPPVQILCPDGTQVASTATNVNEVLSGVLGSAVSLWPLLPADQLDHYRRGASDMAGDPEAYLREVFARTPNEALPDLSAFPPELFEYESPPGTYFDAYPLLLLSSSTLRTLTEAAPQSQFDQRRFRANILFDTEESGFVEDQWAGKRARIGSAELQLELACPRCVMTTHGFDDLAKDPKIMRTLVKQNNGNAGLYASVVKPGTISVGDRIEIL